MNKYKGFVTLIMVTLALIVAFSAINVNKKPSLDDVVINTGKIRIGYIVYPPLLYKDQVTGELSGVSYEIVEAAARKLNLETRWAEEVGWGSAIEGLKSGRYDIVGTQMWPNAARAREAAFSVAPFNSVIYPYARAKERRLKDNLEKLNSPEFTISALDGEMAQFIAEEDYPEANVNTLPQLSSYAEVFLNIMNNKADVTFVEPAAANDFLTSNPGSVVRIGDEPVREFGNSFAFARGEESMVSIWNIALRELINDGEIKRILQRYEVLEHYLLNQ